MANRFDRFAITVFNWLIITAISLVWFISEIITPCDDKLSFIEVWRNTKYELLGDNDV